MFMVFYGFRLFLDGFGIVLIEFFTRLWSLLDWVIRWRADLGFLNKVFSMVFWCINRFKKDRRRTTLSILGWHAGVCIPPMKCAWQWPRCRPSSIRWSTRRSSWMSMTGKARAPLSMTPVALALKANRTDNILSSLHSLGKSVTDFHRQVSEVLPGRYHVQTLGLSADESFLAGYVLNRRRAPIPPSDGQGWMGTLWWVGPEAQARPTLVATSLTASKSRTVYMTSTRSRTNKGKEMKNQ